MQGNLGVPFAQLVLVFGQLGYNWGMQGSLGMLHLEPLHPAGANPESPPPVSANAPSGTVRATRTPSAIAKLTQAHEPAE